MKRIFCLQKLVRDRVPEYMKEEGVTVSFRRLDDAEFVSKISEKLLEEALEVVHAKNLQELLEELGDVLEVIYTLMQAQQITMEQVEQARLAKRATKGGFDARIYMQAIKIEDSHEAVPYFCSKPDKYPEITDIEFEKRFLSE